MWCGEQKKDKRTEERNVCDNSALYINMNKEKVNKKQ